MRSEIFYLMMKVIMKDVRSEVMFCRIIEIFFVIVDLILVVLVVNFVVIKFELCLFLLN